MFAFQKMNNLLMYLKFCYFCIVNMKKNSNLKEKIQQFREWQVTPRVVAPNTEEEHECLNCHDHYTGNYCPRCGQSAKIGRYSFKNALLLFLDVWGMGNRGMFRTLRDLILRGFLLRSFQDVFPARGHLPPRDPWAEHYGARIAWRFPICR